MAADWDTSGFHDGRAQDEHAARPMRRRSGWLGSRRRRYGLITGLVSLAIVGAFIWSGRDGGGPEAGVDPPTIHADEAPIRVAPEDPGGMNIPHQDKLVYQRLPGEGEDPRMERLLPPPEEPLPPPAPEPATAAKAEPALPPDRAAATDEDEDMASVTDGPGGSAGLFPPPDGAVHGPANAPPPRPARDAPRSGPAEPQALARAPTGPGAGPGAGAAEAPRRLLPPDPGSAVATPSPPPGSTALAAPRPTPQLPAASGSYMVQLLAVSSVDQAQAAWTRLRGSNADLLGRLNPAYVRADLGARGVIYRLRAGPIDGETQARAICAQLAGRNVDCVIVSPGG